MNLQIDLAFAQMVAEQIDDYLYSPVLFWPVGTVNGQPMPELSIGTWMMTDWRLSVLAPDSSERINGRAAVVKARQNTVAFGNKVHREFKSRLDSWSLYLDETFKRIDGHDTTLTQLRVRYHANVHHRLILELLKDDTEQAADQLQRLQSLDHRLHASFIEGNFILDPELHEVAPKETFWWLWGELKIA